MSEELRIRAMDFAIAARTSGEQDIVELAQRIYAFLDPQVALTPKGADALKAHVAEIQSEQCIPPPIPQQDLGKADQSPHSFTMGLCGGVPKPFEIQRYEPDPSRNPFDASDTPTRIVRTQAEVE